MCNMVHEALLYKHKIYKHVKYLHHLEKMNSTQESFASVVARPTYVPPQDLKTPFGTWESVVHDITKYSTPKISLAARHQSNERADVIAYENGCWLCGVINEMRSYYDLQGFLDAPDVSWFNRIVEEHIELDDPPPPEEGDDTLGVASDYDDM